MSSVRPVTRISDIPETIEFHIDWLGFKIDWEHRYGDNFRVYMQVSKDDILFHLSEHYSDACPGSKVYIEYTGDLRAYHKDMTGKDYKYYKPSIEKEQGGITMEVMDRSEIKSYFQ